MHVLVRGICRYFCRFLLFYWICFTFPFPLDLVALPLQFVEPKDQPAWMKAADDAFGEGYLWVNREKEDACKWVGEKVFHVEVIIQPTGSGDSMRAYVGCFCAAVSAAAAALLWTVLALFVSWWKLGWRADAFLYGLVRILVRFFLAQMLFSYGFHKVFPLQFPQPSSFRLNEQLGDMSPMGLLWTFMGFSTPYQMFTGAVEVLGGLLLVTRRTTLLGAFVTMAAMAQVFILNMCFDVPVKLYSLHYLVMALYLAAPDMPRLIKVLLLGRAVEARPFALLLENVWIDRTALVLRTLLVAGMLYGQIHGAYHLWSEMYGGPQPPVLGRWEVVSMRVDNKEPHKDDPMIWKSLDFMNKTLVRLSGPTPPNVVYRVAWNPEEKKLTLTKFSTPTWSATFTYDLPQSDALELKGSMDGKVIEAMLKPLPEKSYELKNRGFHWIQELPYNR